MLRSKTIRSFTALLLLLVFTLGITPRIYLHDIVAGHNDTQLPENSGQETVSHSSFHCDVNDLVATSPFTDDVNKLQLAISTDFISFSSVINSLLLSGTCSFIDSRGPPAVG